MINKSITDRIEIADKAEIYCYEISSKILFYPQSKLLINFSGDKVLRTQLRNTMSNLLDYFLVNGRKGPIPEDEILLEVWEKKGLQASTHRLWQVSRDLNYKLKILGLTDMLFGKIYRKRHYFINYTIVVPLYINKEQESFKYFQRKSSTVGITKKETWII